MTSRDRIVVAVVAVVALLGAYWFLILGPKRSEAQKLSSEVSQAQQARDAAVAEASSSRAAQAQYPTNYAAVARLGKAIPADDDVPSLVYQLSSVSQAAKIDFRTVKLSTDGGAASSTPTAAASPRASTPPAPASGSAAAPVRAAQGATAGLPPGAVVGPAGLPTLPFSFTFTGGFFRLSDFFARLDALIAARKNGVDVRGRLLTVDGIALTEGPGGFPTMTATVAATAFLVPTSEGPTNGATPGAPSPSGAQSVSNPASSRTGTSTPALIAPVSP